MRLKFLFYGNENVINNHPFTMKSGYTPNFANTAIENYIFATKIELGRIHLHKFKDNLTKSERMALQSLKQNKEIVIKKADKNSSTVILDKKNYIEQALSQLNDGIHYEQIAISHCTEIYNLIESKVKILHEQSHIDDISLRYLLDTKVEKFKLADYIYYLKFTKLTSTSEMKLGVIKNYFKGPIERIGQFIDYFLQPIVRQLWTFTQDTTFFINKIERIEAPDNVMLATFDISSMYTNLSHEEIIQDVYRAWPKLIAYNYAIPLPPRNEFLELLRITLENNEFEFNSVIYKQIVGVPMGAPMSPSLTDLRFFEIISKILKEFTHAFKIIHLSVYRDDGFMLFAGNDNELVDFFEIANNIHPLIKFTHETSRTNVHFLDVTVYKGKRFITNTILDIKLYRKLTDNYQYLHRSSSHPSSVFKRNYKIFSII
ncbi:unnamed protein product [Mytilus edulis]|nr:unnamed protein product [Mytilus edulis]